jgi:hypothetical protein
MGVSGMGSTYRAGTSSHNFHFEFCNSQFAMATPPVTLQLQIENGKVPIANCRASFD